MRTQSTLLAAALVSAMSLGAVAYAQNAPTPMTSSSSSHSAMSSMSKPSASDMTFAKKASAANLAEVQLGQLASSHAQSQAVKDFGARMVTDHTKAQDKLTAIASAQNMTLPTSPMAKQQKLITKMQGLNGAAFDKMYSTSAVKDHKEDVALFKKESMKGKDSQLKSFAASTLPTLEEHLKMAKALPDNSGDKMAGN